MKDLSKTALVGTPLLASEPGASLPPAPDQRPAVDDAPLPVQAQLDTLLQDASRSLEQTICDLNAIGAWASFLVYSIRHHLDAARTKDERTLMERTLEAGIFSLCMRAVERVQTDRTAILETIMAASSAACALSMCSTNPFARLFELRHYSSLIPSRKPSMAAMAPTVDRAVARVVWLNKGRLEELVHQLLGHKLITSKSVLFDLFSSSRHANVHVAWDLSRKAHLAHLWHQLYVKGMIRAEGSKGYFAFAEAHFTGMNGEVLHRNALKRLSSAINVDPDRFARVITDVEGILDATKK